MRAVEHAHAAALWDVHHPFKFFGEPLAETYQSLKPYIRHVHLKDSAPGTGADGGVRYCLLGQGIMPVEQVIGLLRDGGYQEWIAFEWEKRWHPEIEEPEVALPAFIRTFRDAEATATGRRQDAEV
jgi:sugar phosphate isomerase/epimerase